MAKQITRECCPPLLAEPLGEGDAEDLARAFAALADPVRLRLLSLIADAQHVASSPGSTVRSSLPGTSTSARTV